MAENYDQVYGQADWFGARESHLLKRYGELLPAGASVLDIGVGQGRNALPLARLGCRVTGLDTSRVAIETAGDRARSEGLELDLQQTSFLDYRPDGLFDAVLCFGLLQMLNPANAASLISRLSAWTRPGGALFLTAWHVDDPNFDLMLERWERLGLRSFRSRDGSTYRLFLGRGEVRQLFLSWNAIHHWEGLGEIHRHGNGTDEQHGVVEAVLKRPTG